MALNTVKLIKVCELGENQRLFYNAEGDALTAVTGSGYFNDAADARALRTGDLLDVVANGGTEFQTYLISNADGVITLKTAAAASSVPAASGDDGG